VFVKLEIEFFVLSLLIIWLLNLVSWGKMSQRPFRIVNEEKLQVEWSFGSPLEQYFLPEVHSQAMLSSAHVCWCDSGVAFYFV
jgi:hypothetical protein